jgi:hypothetical protein
MGRPLKRLRPVYITFDKLCYCCLENPGVLCHDRVCLTKSRVTVLPELQQTCQPLVNGLANRAFYSPNFDVCGHCRL